MSSAYRSRPSSATGSGSFAQTRFNPSSSSSKSATLSQTKRSSSSSFRPTSASRSATSGGAGGYRNSSSYGQRSSVERNEELEGNLLAANLKNTTHTSKEEKEHLIESLAAEQNGYLLMLLEKEQSNESERQKILAAVDDVGDQRRLEKIFGIERAKASAVIKRVTKDHERALALKMHELGMISDEEDDEDL